MIDVTAELAKAAQQNELSALCDLCDLSTTRMQLTANFVQQAANLFTVSELTRSIRSTLPLVILSEVACLAVALCGGWEESLKVF
jgi:hypothetical protein